MDEQIKNLIEGYDWSGIITVKAAGAAFVFPDHRIELVRDVYEIVTKRHPGTCCSSVVGIIPPERIIEVSVTCGEYGNGITIGLTELPLKPLREGSHGS